MAAIAPFTLVKWYLDCVAETGDAAIVYCAKLRWRGIHASYGSVLAASERGVESHASLSGYRVSSSPEEIAVELPRLRVSGRWAATAAPARVTVYEDAKGSVQWNCVQPRSSVALRVGDRELTGLGYAECLAVTVPPWRLPMRTLRWGRFVSEQDSLAWVDWQGPYSTCLAIHNGRRCEALAVGDSRVTLPDATLEMDDSLSLRSGKLGSTVLPGAPGLRKLLPHSLFKIREEKWRSRGALKTSGRTSFGWAIHEVVHWDI